MVGFMASSCNHCLIHRPRARAKEEAKSWNLEDASSPPSFPAWPCEGIDGEEATLTPLPTVHLCEETEAPQGDLPRVPELENGRAETRSGLLAPVFNLPGSLTLS